jgi:hypothetical protein
MPGMSGNANERDAIASATLRESVAECSLRETAGSDTALPLPGTREKHRPAPPRRRETDTGRDPITGAGQTRTRRRERTGKIVPLISRHDR